MFAGPDWKGCAVMSMISRPIPRASRPGSLALLAALAFMPAACGSNDSPWDGNGNGDALDVPDRGDGSCSVEGERQCFGEVLQTCVDGSWKDEEACVVPKLCDSELGCVDCIPARGRVCVGDVVHECDPGGSVGAEVETCPPSHCSGGDCEGECPTGTELIYVVDMDDNLWSFDPRDDLNEFTLLGRLDCPAGPSWPGYGSTVSGPFSMSVDRTGRAWVLYTSGEIFFVNIYTLDCESSPFVPGSSGLELFCMGFVSDSEGSDSETLFVAGGLASQFQSATPTLAMIERATAGLTTIGPLGTGIYWPEFTGTGAAELFGYIPGANATVTRFDKETGAVSDQWVLPPWSAEVGAYAFAHWGGRFYIFASSTDGLTQATTVRRFDPLTGDTQIVVPSVPQIIVGAGVSTCAPTLL
jgi:hypothetical protein